MAIKIQKQMQALTWTEENLQFDNVKPFFRNIGSYQYIRPTNVINACNQLDLSSFSLHGIVQENLASHLTDP